VNGQQPKNFMIDPPWPKRKGGLRSARPHQTRELAYKTLTVPDIFKLLDEQIFPATQHNVFLWTVDQFLPEAEREMSVRGYRQHCRFIWDKLNGVAPAFTIRYSHEYLLWYYKPKFMVIDAASRGKFRTVFQEKAREHSRKPIAAYEMIEQMYPNVPRMDVFSRESRIGWEQYGDQCDFYSEQASK
jgi:N6-adenosine-specific RNA methylase IME4